MWWFLLLNNLLGRTNTEQLSEGLSWKSHFYFCLSMFDFTFIKLKAIILFLEEHLHNTQNGTEVSLGSQQPLHFLQHCPQLQFPLNHVTRAAVRHLPFFALKSTILRKKNELLLVQSRFQKQVQADLNLFVDSNYPDHYMNAVLAPVKSILLSLGIVSANLLWSRFLSVKAKIDMDRTVTFLCINH